MRAVDVSVVTYDSDPALLRQLFASLAEPVSPPVAVNLLIHDNSPRPEGIESLRAELEANPAFARVDIRRSGENLGFGRGHNANAARGKADWFLVINPDCMLEPGALATLLAAAQAVAGVANRLPNFVKRILARIARARG